jgi:hypothetical protein
MILASAHPIFIIVGMGRSSLDQYSRTRVDRWIPQINRDRVTVAGFPPVIIFSFPFISLDTLTLILSACAVVHVANQYITLL